ncbi:hypothetical protein O9K51_00783 [Purpureocillium lavendulum]|uniref:Uncharacterized protein n=1 Tax=Purpureocillium lavendulum TaxID=1247861 RepID=A0AB34G5E4_9HYPO|nr:hypothetical protein O9K51_00783 [Purpureocillium lavendulum]
MAKSIPSRKLVGWSVFAVNVPALARRESNHNPQTRFTSLTPVYQVGDWPRADRKARSNKAGDVNTLQLPRADRLSAATDGAQIKDVGSVAHDDVDVNARRDMSRPVASKQYAPARDRWFKVAKADSFPPGGAPFSRATKTACAS